jgi:hypothetical protein
MIENENIQILSVEAKDLLVKDYKVNDKTIRKGSLDYSMETDELRNLGKTLVKIDNNKSRYYTYSIINVTFKYAINEDMDELIKSAINTYISNVNKINSNNLKFHLKQVKEKNKIKELRQYWDQKNTNEIYNVRKANKYYEYNKKEIRYEIYKNGFDIEINGITRHFVRYKRTSGSARVGKCLFIDDRYYKKMIDWSFSGIEHKQGTEMDCAGMEAYISLPTSSSIDRFLLKPENILLIDDETSMFEDTVMATRLINQVEDDDGNIIDGDLYTDIDTTSITNKIFDGEALLDKSIFETKGYTQGMIIRNPIFNNIFIRYDDKAILQARNKMYKGIGINTDIQQFFKDNNITSISQLNGQTIATDIKQIKLITTPSSVKYLKFGSFENWLKQIEDLWAICKYEKPQHHFNGMCQTHYQLLNTLGMSKNDMNVFLKDTIDYINLLKSDTSVFKYHLGLNSDIIDEDDIFYKEELRKPINNTNDLILSMLEINDDFINTRMCKKFRENAIYSYINNVRHGHVLVNGNYSVLVSCPYEYLLASIGKFKGESILKPFECVSSKFKEGEEILGVRSPEPTMSNITIFKNTKNSILDTYFNTKSNEVLYFSSIKNNILELLSSADMDGDQLLLTNNDYLVKSGKKLQDEVKINGKSIKRFLVSTDFTPKSSIKRKYTPEDLADTDIKCSENRIGEIINLAQILNSLYWDKKSKGCSEEELFDLYKDISNLNILSCIEIDRAKKISPVNAKKELDKIRKKHSLGKGIIIRNKQQKEVGIRPKFFKYLDGGKDYKFNWFNTGMDYLEKILDEEIIKKDKKQYTQDIFLSDLLLNIRVKKSEKAVCDRLKKLVVDMKVDQSKIWSGEYDNKYELTQDIYNNTLVKLENFNITEGVVYTIIDRTSKGYINDSMKEWKGIGLKMLKLLYDFDKRTLFKLIKFDNKNYDILVEDKKGEIKLYGYTYRKIAKNSKNDESARFSKYI